MYVIRFTTLSSFLRHFFLVCYYLWWDFSLIFIFQPDDICSKNYIILLYSLPVFTVCNFEPIVICKFGLQFLFFWTFFLQFGSQLVLNHSNMLAWADLDPGPSHYKYTLKLPAIDTFLRPKEGTFSSNHLLNSSLSLVKSQVAKGPWIYSLQITITVL